MFTGTDEQLINALNHMADNRPITKVEKTIVAEAAKRLGIAIESGQASDFTQKEDLK